MHFINSNVRSRCADGMLGQETRARLGDSSEIVINLLRLQLFGNLVKFPTPALNKYIYEKWNTFMIQLNILFYTRENKFGFKV